MAVTTRPVDDADPADVAAALRAARTRLAEDGPSPGRAWCEAWTAEVDAAVRALWAGCPTRDAVTVVAVGGYGRRELCPGSDVDLLVVHDDLDARPLDAVAQSLFHPLWDAGCKLGNAVRTPRQLVGDALDELDTATALLDGRVVAGASERFERGHARLVERLASRPRTWLPLLAEADEARRTRAGDAAEQLEPDLKSGAGGLRDVQSLRWAAAAVVGGVGLDVLVPDGHIGAADAARLHAAEDELLALRVALHLETGAPTDVLRLEHQQAVALRVGEVDGEDDLDTAAHRALTRHFLAARTIEHVHDRAWRLLSASVRRPWRRSRPVAERVAGLEVLDGTVRIPDGLDVLDPTMPARLVRALLVDDAVLDRHAATTLREAAGQVDLGPVWPEDLQEAFAELAWAGDAVVRVTAELDDVGWLVALLPEWAPLRGRAQRNPYHRYSLDRHAVHALAELGRLVHRDERAAAALDQVARPDVLAIAALLHDVGKAFGEPHSETGVPVALAIGRRVGLDDGGLDLLATLVRHHLLLPDVGTRRDVSDPAEAAAVAELVGDVSTLMSLWLLAAADGVATGRSAWSSWRQQLVRTLVAKVRAVLDERDPAALDDGPAATRADAVELAPSLGVAPAAVDEHLGRLPQRYAAAVSPRTVVRHAGLAATRPEPVEVRTRVTPGVPMEDGLEFDELDVVAIDTPGLFAKVAGVLALHGGSVLEAHAHTRTDGIAVDTFTVVLPEHATGSWWVMVEGDLVEAVSGRLAVRARVARKRASESRRISRLPQVPTRVTTTRDASGRTTVVEVHTLDRVGVLYRIASALAELELDLVVAKVGTFGHEAHDVFTVRDGDGQPLDEDHESELRLAIEAALTE